MSSAAKKLSSKVTTKKQPAFKSLSIVIPAYNEEATVFKILEKILQVPLQRPFEIIVVNDGSTDRTEQEVFRFRAKHPDISLKYLKQKNQGKGGAFQTGAKIANNDIVIVQDADLEYDPMDYLPILKKIDEGAKVVYGSRNLNQGRRPHSHALFHWGGKLVTLWTNILFGSSLTDEATCYKCFRKEVLQSSRLTRLGFGWEPEVTAQVLKSKIEIVEVPISYYPRAFSEGKKISWKDGAIALWVLLYERFRKD